MFIQIFVFAAIFAFSAPQAAHAAFPPVPLPQEPVRVNYRMPTPLVLTWGNNATRVEIYSIILLLTPDDEIMPVGITATFEISEKAPRSKLIYEILKIQTLNYLRNQLTFPPQRTILGLPHTTQEWLALPSVTLLPY